MSEQLRDHTTLRLGGPARDFVTAGTEAELVEAVRRADEAGEPVLVLGGGSNLVVSDEGFDGTVVKVATRGIEPDVEDAPADGQSSCGGVMVTVAAGETWDDLVARAVASQWVGIEALSGIPGSVGATPIQNVGAYGQEVAQTIASVRVWDRDPQGRPHLRQRRLRLRLPAQPVQGRPGRHVVLDVTFQFRQGTLGAPATYAELVRTLGVETGGRAPLQDVRDAVLVAAPGQGHGARRRRPRHVERRVVLHQPRRRRPTSVPDGCAGLAAARRHASRPAPPG